MAVGQGFGAFNNKQKRMMRMPVNPLDKSTIVTVYLRVLDIYNPTLFPGTFRIPAATPNDFEILVVGPSSWFKAMEEGQPYLEIPNSSIQVAESIIRDYTNGLVGCDMNDKMMGLFYVPGEYTKVTIMGYVDQKTKKTFKQMLEEAREKQKNWFKELVEIADVDWARTNGNPRSVSDDSRMAAEQLGLSKSWMQDFRQMELVNCRACGHLGNPDYPVCANCKTIINEIKAKEMGIKFAI